MGTDLEDIMKQLEKPKTQVRVPRTVQQVEEDEAKQKLAALVTQEPAVPPVSPPSKVDASSWLSLRQDEIQGVLKSLSTIKSYTVGDPTANLNRMHTVATNVREQQAYILTQLTKVVNMQLEVRRMLAQATHKYKDAMGDAFETHKEQIGNARSLEERELRLRKHVPAIKEKEEWEETLESVLLLKEAVQMVYDDMSKAAMTLATQVNVLKQQILIGELKIVDSGLMKVFSDSTLEAVETARASNVPRGKSQL